MTTMKDDLSVKYTEYKEKYEETNKLYQDLLQKYNSEINSLQKDLALARQELEWKTRETNELKTRKEELEAEIRDLKVNIKAMKNDIDSRDETIKQLKAAPKPQEPPADWQMEKNFLKSQVDTLKAQLDDNKSVQEALVAALQTRQQDSSRSDSKDPAKHLSMALEKTEERCRQLEAKIVKLKRYQKMVKASASIQCKMCGKNFASGVFSGHVTSCQENYEKTTEAGNYSIIVKQIVVRDDVADQKPFTEYEICISYKSRNWTVMRRFKNFALLHSAIQREFPSLEVPEASNLFPSQSGGLFNSKPALSLEDRRRASQDYLTGVANVNCIKNSQFFKKFIGADQHFPDENA
jgi:predicted  nucleic acid-binding Zn-ribbon protein